MFSVATWNVNGLRPRLSQVLRLLDEYGPDVLALQETRTDPDAATCEALRERGYHLTSSGRGGYAGVAIVSRRTPDAAIEGIPGFAEAKAPGRRLACRFGSTWIDNVYVPTRKAIGKVPFLDALAADHAERFADQPLVLVGDFNICFDRRDFASPSMVSDADLHPHRPEDLAFRRLLADDLVDVFRERCDEAGHFSWFPNPPWALRRNYGMRLDYVFARRPLAAGITTIEHLRAVRSWERPSDHLPVLAHFDASLDGPA